VPWRRITLLLVGGAAVVVAAFWITLAVLRDMSRNGAPPPGRGVCYFDAERLCPGSSLARGEFSNAYPDR
jgi:hypothetical protein